MFAGANLAELQVQEGILESVLRLLPSSLTIASEYSGSFFVLFYPFNQLKDNQLGKEKRESSSPPLSPGNGVGNVEFFIPEGNVRLVPCPGFLAALHNNNLKGRIEM